MHALAGKTPFPCPRPSSCSSKSEAPSRDARTPRNSAVRRPAPHGCPSAWFARGTAGVASPGPGSAPLETALASLRLQKLLEIESWCTLSLCSSLFPARPRACVLDSDPLASHCHRAAPFRQPLPLPLPRHCSTVPGGAAPSLCLQFQSLVPLAFSAGEFFFSTRGGSRLQAAATQRPSRGRCCTSTPTGSQGRRLRASSQFAAPLAPTSGILSLDPLQFPISSSVSGLQ